MLVCESGTVVKRGVGGVYGGGTETVRGGREAGDGE